MVAGTPYTYSTVSGYIGGDAFHALYEANPDFDYTLVVRNKEREELVRRKYPNTDIKIVYPGAASPAMSLADVLEEEARKADVVLRMSMILYLPVLTGQPQVMDSKLTILQDTAESADDAVQAKAILRGLQAAGRSPEHPAYWIHVSGTGILQWVGTVLPSITTNSPSTDTGTVPRSSTVNPLPPTPTCNHDTNLTLHWHVTKKKYDQTHNRVGQHPLPSAKYDDIADIDRILTLPDQALHRDVDKIVLSANDNSSIKTAIVAPPTIYGFGRGPVNNISQQIPSLTRFVLRHGYAPIVGQNGGEAEWDHVHVRDVSELLVGLVRYAAGMGGGGAAAADSPEVFGGRAYYFCESGTHVWGKVAVEIAGEAVRRGFLKEVVVCIVFTCSYLVLTHLYNTYTFPPSQGWWWWGWRWFVFRSTSGRLCSALLCSAMPCYPATPSVKYLLLK
jgi:hypothetical protein